MKIKCDDLFVNDCLKKMEDIDKKNYRNVFSALSIIGNFNNEINLFLYEKKIDNGEEIIKLFCEDDSGDIFILTPVDSRMKNVFTIETCSEEKDCIYDLTLLKKNEVSEDNIVICKTLNRHNFKNGRVITDNNSFINIFVGKENIYTFEIANMKHDISIVEFLRELNNCDEVLNYTSLMQILYKYIESDFDEIRSKYFNNYLLIDDVVIDNISEGQKNIVKRRV